MGEARLDSFSFYFRVSHTEPTKLRNPPNEATMEPLTESEDQI